MGKNFLKYSTAFLVLTLSFIVKGQQDTSLILKTIEVVEYSIKEKTVGKENVTWTVDSLLEAGVQNVSELLEKEAGVFIKSYGLGSLATSSIRGASASQTLVLWNGMPIQNPMLGLLDLSLLPIHAIEEVSLQKGGKSALWGSGAIGGVLGLNSQPQFEKRLSVWGQISNGSFNRSDQAISLRVGDETFQAQTKFSNSQSKNDFYYEVPGDQPDRKQINAALSQQNFLQDIFWNPSPKIKLAAHFWRQKSTREVPPTNVQLWSDAFQEDKHTRVIFKGKFIHSQSITEAQVGYAKEHINYYSATPFTEFESQFSNLNASLGHQRQFGESLTWYLGSTYQYTQTISDGYLDDEPDENRFSFLSSLQIQKEKWALQLSGEQGFADSNRFPIVPAVGISMSPNNWLGVNMNISKNYRHPTLNDRYWRPGGNIDLQPESGWSQEVEITSRLQSGTAEFDISVGGFNRNIDNWILWTRLDGAFYFIPINLKKVWSRGLESRLAGRFPIGGLNLGFNMGYDHIRSTYQFDLGSPRIEKGDQLAYTPRHQAFFKIHLKWKGIGFQYRHHYISSTLGINDEVPAYQLADIGLQYKYEKESHKANLFFNINNIWNKNYVVIERRPMPGVNFELGIAVNFIKQISSKESD